MIKWKDFIILWCFSLLSSSYYYYSIPLFKNRLCPLIPLYNCMFNISVYTNYRDRFTTFLASHFTIYFLIAPANRHTLASSYPSVIQKMDPSFPSSVTSLPENAGVWTIMAMRNLIRVRKFRGEQGIVVMQVKVMAIWIVSFWNEFLWSIHVSKHCL